MSIEQKAVIVAFLYLISVSFFLLVGGLLAMVIRLELLTPQSDLMNADTYNKVFTMHGIVILFFVLIPPFLRSSATSFFP